MNLSDLVSNIRSGKPGRDKAIELLYYDTKLRYSIKSVVRKMGGNNDQAIEMLSVAIMKFIKTVVTNKEFTLTSSVINYITGIAKFTFLNNQKKQTLNSAALIDDFDFNDDAPQPSELIIKKEKFELLTSILSNLGKNCKEVLMLWGNGYKMNEIADKLGYKSSDMAKKKKYQCFKSLMKTVNSNSHIKEALN